MASGQDMHEWVDTVSKKDYPPPHLSTAGAPMEESEGEDDVGPFEVFGVMGGVTAPIRKLTAENRCEPQ